MSRSPLWLAVLLIGCAPQRQAAPMAGTVGGARSSPSGVSQSACVPPHSSRLEMELVAQRSESLCWAAVTQMVASSFGIQTDQCSLIEARTPGCACATCPAPPPPATSDEAPPPDRCNTGIWPDFASVGLSGYRRRGAPLTLSELKHELGCRQRPVAFSWKTTPGSGHIMVAYGYTGDQIEVADPWAPCAGMKRTISYETYVHGPHPGSSRHWDDFYGFHVVAPHVGAER